MTIINKIELELLLSKNERRKPFSNSKFYKIAIQADNIMQLI